MHCYLEENEERARAKRKEAHLVSLLCNKIKFDGFKQMECAGNDVSFGSRKDRVVLPVKSCFWDPKHSLYTDPAESFNKVQCVVSTVPRFSELSVHTQVPAPNFYKLPLPKKVVWKFDKDLPRPDYVNCNSVPGPGTYKLPPPSFAVSHKRKPACYTICSPYHEATCYNCHQVTTMGDYYFSAAEGGVSCCRSCYLGRLRKLDNNDRIVDRIKTSTHLSNFHKVRSCDYYHQHLDTERAVTRLSLSKRSWKQKLKLENYLAQFEEL